MGTLAADSVTKDRSAPRFVYITGCDGTGKTTQARLLLEQLQQQGVKVRHVWLRFPFLFSAPLLAFARWRGYSWSEVHGQVRHGYWDFHRSRLMRSVFPWILWVDAAIATLWKVCLPLRFGYTIVCERFVLDMLVDLSAGLRDAQFGLKLPGRLFFRLLPFDARVVCLDLDTQSICQRRRDLESDRALEMRLAIFRSLTTARGLAVVHNDESVAVTLNKIRILVES
jgi:thymidylate kinase